MESSEADGASHTVGGFGPSHAGSQCLETHSDTQSKVKSAPRLCAQGAWADNQPSSLPLLPRSLRLGTQVLGLLEHGGGRGEHARKAAPPLSPSDPLSVAWSRNRSMDKEARNSSSSTCKSHPCARPTPDAPCRHVPGGVRGQQVCLGGGSALSSGDTPVYNKAPEDPASSTRRTWGSVLPTKGKLSEAPRGSAPHQSPRARAGGVVALSSQGPAAGATSSCPRRVTTLSVSKQHSEAL